MLKYIMAQPLRKMFRQHWKRLVREALETPQGTAHRYIQTVVQNRYTCASAGFFKRYWYTVMTYGLQSVLYEVLKEWRVRKEFGLCPLGFRNIQIQCATDNIAEISVYLGGMSHDIAFFYAYQAILARSPESIVIDVGANIGMHTLAIAALAKGAVYAYEPSPVFHRLAENIQHNQCKNVRLKNTAIGSSSGEIGFEDWSHSISTGLSHVNQAASHKVPLTTLDQELGRSSLPVGLIKIDTEGFELEVLKGAQNILKTFRPVIVFEFNPDAYHIDNIIAAIPYERICYAILKTAYQPVCRISYQALKHRHQNMNVMVVPSDYELFC